MAAVFTWHTVYCRAKVPEVRHDSQLSSRCLLYITLNLEVVFETATPQNGATPTKREENRSQKGGVYFIIALIQKLVCSYPAA